MAKVLVEITPTTRVQVTLTQYGKFWADDMYNKYGVNYRLDWDENGICVTTHDHLLHIYGGPVVQKDGATKQFYTRLFVLE